MAPGLSSPVPLNTRGVQGCLWYCRGLMEGLKEAGTFESTKNTVLKNTNNLNLQVSRHLFANLGAATRMELSIQQALSQGKLEPKSPNSKRTDAAASWHQTSSCLFVGRYYGRSTAASQLVAATAERLGYLRLKRSNSPTIVSRITLHPEP